MTTLGATVDTIRLEQAARQANVPARQILAWIRDGLLPARWSATGWRMKPRAIDAVARTAAQIADLRRSRLHD